MKCAIFFPFYFFFCYTLLSQCRSTAIGVRTKSREHSTIYYFIYSYYIIGLTLCKRLLLQFYHKEFTIQVPYHSFLGGEKVSVIGV